MRIDSRTALLAMVVGAFFALAGCASTSSVPSEGAKNLYLLYGNGAEEIETILPEAGELRVYWFWSSQSQCSRRAEPGIGQLMQAHPDVEVLLVHSNADESSTMGREVAEKRELPAPLYRDEGARLAVEFDARMTPEVVVVDAEGVVYQGRPVRFEGERVVSFVSKSVDSYQRGEEVDPAYRRPSGCVIRQP